MEENNTIIKEETISELGIKLIEGMTKAYQKLVESKKKNGGMLIFSENGKIIKVKP